MNERERKVELLKSKGIKYKQFVFEGNCNGRCEGFPFEEDNYYIESYGELSNYYKGSDKYDGWVRVYEYYMSGVSEYPSYYFTLYIQESDLIKVENEVKKEIEEVNKFFFLTEL